MNQTNDETNSIFLAQLPPQIPDKYFWRVPRTDLMGLLSWTQLRSFAAGISLGFLSLRCTRGCNIHLLMPLPKVLMSELLFWSHFCWSSPKGCSCQPFALISHPNPVCSISKPLSYFLLLLKLVSVSRAPEILESYWDSVKMTFLEFLACLSLPAPVGLQNTEWQNFVVITPPL